MYKYKYRDKTEQRICENVVKDLKEKYPNITEQEVLWHTKEFFTILRDQLCAKEHISIPYFGNFVYRHDLEVFNHRYLAAKAEGKSDEEIKKLITTEERHKVRREVGFAKYGYTYIHKLPYLIPSEKINLNE